jgi:hypothetical protein
VRIGFDTITPSVNSRMMAATAQQLVVASSATLSFALPELRA